MGGSDETKLMLNSAFNLVEVEVEAELGKIYIYKAVFQVPINSSQSVPINSSQCVPINSSQCVHVSLPIFET